MKKKLSLLLILCLVACTFAFAACGGKEPDPAEVPLTAAEKLINGRFAYGYEVPPNDKKNTTGFFRFYGEQAGIGKVFYAYLSGTVFGGTYKLEETNFNYSVYFNRDDVVADNGASTASQKQGTAAYTISFFDFYGNAMGKSGFDGDYLYHPATAGSATEKVYAQGMGPVRFTRDTASNTYKDNSGNDIYGYETLTPAVLCNYINNDDKSSTIEIYHNLTYSDLVNTAIEGSWTLAVASSVKTFTLTPKEAGSTACSLVIAADGKTAVYNAGSTAVNMTRASDYVSEVTTLTTATRLSGTAGGYPVTYEYTLTLYDDGSCKLVRVTYMTNPIATNTIDTGTWEKTSGKVEFTFEEAGALDATIGGETVTLNYTDGDIGTAVITGDATVFEKSALAVVYTGKAAFPLGGSPDYTLTIYDDGTCILTAAMTATMILTIDSGTWTAGYGGIPGNFVFENAGAKNATPGVTFTLAYSGTHPEYGAITVTLTYDTGYGG